MDFLVARSSLVLGLRGDSRSDCLLAGESRVFSLLKDPTLKNKNLTLPSFPPLSYFATLEMFELVGTTLDYISP